MLNIFWQRMPDILVVVNSTNQIKTQTKTTTTITITLTQNLKHFQATIHMLYHNPKTRQSTILKALFGGQLPLLLG